MEIGSNNFRDYLLKNIKAGSNKTNGKSNNKENINFKDYLLRNEKWLGTGDEAGTGNHKTDGILNNEEISIFFSQFNSPY